MTRKTKARADYAKPPTVVAAEAMGRMREEFRRAAAIEDAAISRFAAVYRRLGVKLSRSSLRASERLGGKLPAALWESDEIPWAEEDE